jgi:hypothetical protein
VYKYIILLLLLVAMLTNQYSQGHFFGTPKQVGNYQVIFNTSPAIPLPEETTFLNFSLLDSNGNNVFNVALSIEIKEGEQTVHTFPEKRYEFSDITQQYAFPEEGSYKVVYNAKVAGDDALVTVDFDVTVAEESSQQWEGIVALIGIAAFAALGFVLLKFRKRK